MISFKEVLDVHIQSLLSISGWGMAWWLAHLATTLEEPGLIFHPDMDAQLLFFLFFPFTGNHRN